MWLIRKNEVLLMFMDEPNSETSNFIACLGKDEFPEVTEENSPVEFDIKLKIKKKRKPKQSTYIYWDGIIKELCNSPINTYYVDNDELLMTPIKVTFPSILAKTLRTLQVGDKVRLSYRTGKGINAGIIHSKIICKL